MKRMVWFSSVWLLLLALCCKGSGDLSPTNGDNSGGDNDLRPASLGIVGDTADIKTNTQGGVVLMGGGTDVDAAFQWMIARSGGGDAVIIRASGTDAYN